MLLRYLLLAPALCLCGCKEPEAALLLVDQDAGSAKHPGAVFRVDPQDGKVSLFATSPLWRQPQDILQERSGDFLVLDYYDEGGVGKIFRLSKDGQKCEELTLPPGLVDPYLFEHAPDGSIWIVDKNADPRGLGRAAGVKTGTLWRLTEGYGSLEIIATGPPIAAPSGLMFVGDDVYLMDADSFQRKNGFKPGHDEGAIFKVRKHPAKLETLVKFKGLVSPLGVYLESASSFLVVDVNADPEEPERIHGAVYRVDRESGASTLFARHADFRDPVTCTPFRGALLVVDANADPLGLGDDGALVHYGGSGRGGIYRVDLKSGSVELFAADKQFVNPVRIRVVHL